MIVISKEIKMKVTVMGEHQFGLQPSGFWISGFGRARVEQNLLWVSGQADFGLRVGQNLLRTGQAG